MASMLTNSDVVETLENREAFTSDSIYSKHSILDTDIEKSTCGNEFN